MKAILVLMLCVVFAGSAQAKTVYCSNCSDKVTQAIEKATSLDQLKTLLKEYDELITQTTAQLQMVQQGIDRYANMVKNTVALPANLIRKVSGELSKVARITSALNTIRADVMGIGKVFDELYTAQDELKNLANMPRALLGQGSMTYHTSWDSWSRRVDDSTKATFQLSGAQLKDLENSGELESYINQLLSEPDGQQKAIMAGNQLAALQIQEARQLRELIATKVQSDLASQEKAEKEAQIGEELHRKMLNGFEKIDKKSYPDPF
ncbi:MAG: P-type conjugative transfer protein TrbJ [Desulfovibrio sp.]|nr:P-type conjugative transfer protein TrbJ [Desulfovibrio sp.]